MELSEQKKERSEIIILVNGPGELSSYVKPAIEALNKLLADFRITIVFTPCPYSSGKEMDIARAIQGVSQVVKDSDFVKWMLMGKLPPDIKFGKKGIVVFMGGDVLYGKMIAKKLKYPAIAYTESYAKWPKVYKKYLVPDDKVKEKFKKQGFPNEQISVVGNLMVDSVKTQKDKAAVFKDLGLDPAKKLVSFLPGSREFQVQFTLKFFAETAVEIRELEKGCQFVFVISPYLRAEILEKYLRKHEAAIRDAHIILAGRDQHDVIAASDLVITIPGTNTAEVAILGTPMISVFPSNSSELIPLEGINDLIGRIPLIGFFFKKLYVRMLFLKIRFFAIPNIKTGKEIVPELKGRIQPRILAEKAVSMLKSPDKLAEMRTRLKASLGGPGAAAKIAEEINETLSETA